MDASMPGLPTMLGVATEIAAVTALNASGRLDRFCAFFSDGYLSKETLNAQIPTHIHGVITQSGMLGQSTVLVSPYLLSALTNQSGQLAWALVREKHFPTVVAGQLFRAGGDGYLGRMFGWVAERLLSTETVQKWARDAPCEPQAVLVAQMTTSAIFAPDRMLSIKDMPSLKLLTDTAQLAEHVAMPEPLKNVMTPMASAVRVHAPPLPLPAVPSFPTHDADSHGTPPPAVPHLTDLKKAGKLWPR